MTDTTPPVFDGHNDALLRLWNGGVDTAIEQFQKAEKGQIDLTTAAAGGFAGGFFAMFAPSAGKFDFQAFANPPYDLPLPGLIGANDALGIIAAQAGILHRLEAAGLVRICRTAGDIDRAMTDKVMATVLHLEGAEPIGEDLAALDTLYAAGLRSLGLVWSRPTIFGHGVPFRYPADADIGPGLTAAGKALVRRCLDLRVVVDTSHLNMAGFWDVAEVGAPLVATHSNAHALCPTARNLTDDQLRAVRDTGGMVGLNFGRFFLRPDGGAATDGTLEMCVDHLAHMVEVAGEDHVGLGSDFDGAPTPPELATCAGLPALRAAMRNRQFGEPLMAKICNENWRGFLGRYWGA